MDNPVYKLPIFQFQGFTLRPAGDADLALAAAWSSADAEHQNTKPEFWIEQGEFAHGMLLMQGDVPVFFFKMALMVLAVNNPKFGLIADITPATPIETAVRIFIQFPAGKDKATRLRSLKGMEAGFDWLEKILSEKGFDAVYFDTKNRELEKLCVRRFGFEEAMRMGERVTLRRKLEVPVA